MVIFSSWLWKAPDPKICSDLPMSGEGTGLGVPSPALAGYLGKRPETCPWCAVKGQTHALRSYRLSFEESVILCTNPQCLFPLVSKPLEDVLACCTPRDIKTQRKRKSPGSPDRGCPAPPLKQQVIGQISGVQCRPCSVDLSRSVVSESILHLGFTKTNGETQSKDLCRNVIPGSPEDRAENKGSELNFVKDSNSQPESKLGEDQHVRLDEKSEISLVEVEPAARLELELSSGQQLEKDVFLPVSGEGLVVAPSHLFWKNEHNLCWLNTLLVALVHCHPLRELSPNLYKDSSPVSRLLATYSQTCSLVKAKEKMYKEAVRVPAAVVCRAQVELDDVRTSIFKQLQPKLRCQLGDKESPVFALPLLLRLDVAAEQLFQHALEWAFECTACGHTFSNRCEKTITTLTRPLPEWHPLTAVHRAPCSRCHHKEQRRRMVLKRVSQVLVLHFVEGLPHSDVTKYSFDFEGSHYSVRIIIQYDQILMHFVTWLRTDQGTWVEFDDLKHPVCIAHENLPVPADQVHVVFWETQGKGVENQFQAHEHNISPSSPLNDTDIVSALTVDNTSVSAESADDSNVSVSNATVLDTFEGLSHSDIVTLTLVEMKENAQEKPQDRSSGIMPDQPGSGDQRVSAGNSESPSSDKASADVVIPSPPEKRLGRKPNTRRQKQLRQSEAFPTTQTGSPTSNNPSLALSTGSNARWSTLLSRHPSFQSTLLSQRSVPNTPLLKTTPKVLDNERLPGKSADMFLGFKSQDNVEPAAQMPNGSQQPSKFQCGNQSDVFKQPWTKLPAPQPSPFPLNEPSGIAEAGTTLPRTCSNDDLSQSSPIKDLSGTDCLRQKLLKKLKKKKMKLVALNQLLAKASGDAVPTPDSTGFTSPSVVSSSTSLYSSPAYSEFFTDIMSPTQASSNLSPDSTSLLEMLASGQEVVVDVPPRENQHVDYSANPQPAKAGGLELPEHPACAISLVEHDFLEEFMSDSCVAKNVDLNAFDLFF